MSLAGWIAASAARHPNRLALRHVGGELTYDGLAREVDAIGRAMVAAGVQRGQYVGWLGPSSAAQLAALFACARLGAVLMLLNWRLTPHEHHGMLADCPIALLVVDEPYIQACAEHDVAAGRGCRVARGQVTNGWTGFDEFVARGSHAELPTAPGAGSAPVLLCWTSGSNAKPKGVLLSANALQACADASVEMHALTADDRILTTTPLFHVGGLNIQTTPALRAGCSVTLHARFDPDATLDAIERERITLASLVPAQIEVLLAHPRWATADLGSLRAVTTGSTFVPQHQILAMHRRGVPLLQVWGATETSPISACLRLGEEVLKAGSAGRAALGVELRIVDQQERDVPTGQSGEILVRGANVMNGYQGDPEGTARALRAGWFHSGDSGYLDAEGYLYVNGRFKDMIISGGENVSPAEIEALLIECPEIAEVAVIGRPDQRWGEVPVAVVVPKPGVSIGRELVLGLCEGRLARYKHPKEVVFLPALPRTALGKVRREELRRAVEGDQGRGL
ncbi:MAG: AMP-binding protein [Rhodocyclaceae bacterium]|jgi:fatty-acyl-CoA synthase|nr:AMP-binding protein [Rhodocyclaceae bacterium]MBK6553053.1 AMP-binding protein [Rhodocyclaceae bacterium]MBK6676003.1 AMP-binding protein [Rhodocyclaceae bacterium]MBK7814825.1 AMP-binding protein [Rhodocyclaceae bacterium]MBK9311374.1 AMP-binding protein [Rhodocyclaceae bacterium]